MYFTHRVRRIAVVIEATHFIIASTGTETKKLQTTTRFGEPFSSSNLERNNPDDFFRLTVK